MSVRSFRRAQVRRIDRERRRASRLARTGRMVGATLGASALFASAAQAATTYTVNTNADDAPGGTCAPSPGTCTLRDALSSANSGSTAATIVFDPSVTGTITLTNGALPLSQDNGITISGPGATKLAVSGNHSSQVFTVSGSSTSSTVEDQINGLTVEYGTSSSQGGGIDVTDNEMPLSLSGDVIRGSTSSNENGGGGVYSESALAISNSTISGNTASGGSGGGVSSGDFNPLTISHTTISGNSARSGGGVGAAYPSGDKYDQGGDVTISASTITGNQALGSAEEVTGGGGVSGRFLSLSINGSKVTGNSAFEDGGGIADAAKYGMTLTNSTVSGNTSPSSGASYGGGISVEDLPYKYSPLKIAGTTISGNTARDGGGIDFDNIGPGDSTTIVTSTISGNHAPVATGSDRAPVIVGATPATWGGGIDLGKYVQGQFHLLDSTVSGNTATYGGGLSLGDQEHKKLLGKYHQEPGTAEGRPGSISLENSTISGNAAAASGGGIYLGDYQYNTSSPEHSGVASIVSTDVSGDKALGSAQDLSRAPGSTTGGFNAAYSLIQTPGTAPLLSKQEVITGVNPQLGALAYNGGPTQTMLPSGTSPLIDQGHREEGLTIDQRGDARTVDTSVPNPPGGDGTDIGAVELPASSVLGANFQVLFDHKTLGGPSRLLLAGRSTPVLCSLRYSTISSCVMTVRIGGKVVARGSATTSQTNKHHLFLRVHPTAAGRKLLKKHPLGLKGSAQTVANYSSSTSLTGNVRVLAGPYFTLRTGGSAPNLSGNVKGELDKIASLLTGVKTVKCVAHASKASDASTQAQSACGRLKKDGLTATYTSSGKGGAAGSGRRLIIRFRF